MKHVLTIQNTGDDSIGYLGEIMRSHGVAYENIRADENETLPNPTDYDALIVLGGSQHVYEDEHHPYLREEKVLIRRAALEGVPSLCICLGGQLLAHALGAEVKRHTTTYVGFYDVQLTEEGQSDPLFAGLPGYQKVFHWHEDIFDIPEGAVLLATNVNTRYQVFRYGKLAYGLQYHIEVNPIMLDAWLNQLSLRQEIIDTIGTDAYNAIIQDKARQYPTYLEHARTMFENFLKIGGLI